MIQQLTQLGLTEEDATAIKAAADDASASPLVYEVSVDTTLTAGSPPRVPVYLVDSTAEPFSLTLPTGQAVGAEIRVIGSAPASTNDIAISHPNNPDVQIYRGTAASTTLGDTGYLLMPDGGCSVHLVHVGGEKWSIIAELGANTLS